MMRLAILAAIVLAVYRLLVGRWPWEKKVSVKARALQQARQVLGVSPGAARSDILAAHRRKVARVHPDKGGSGAGVHEANEARDLLLAELPLTPTLDPKEPS